MSELRIIPTISALVFLALIYLIGYWAYRSSKGKAFKEDWLVSSREIGGFALAMMLTATYLSASSFVGGPGAAYKFGLGWVLLAAVQIPVTLVSLSVLGKKFAIVARKVNAITVVDILKARYQSDIVTIIGSVSIVLFFIASMMAQFIGGATIFQTITGLPYTYGLALFAITILVYIILGGMRGVALVDTIFGVIMTLGSIGLIGGSIIKAGGVTPIISHLRSIDPGLVTPYGPNMSTLNPLWVASFWVLVCFATVGLPHVSVQGLVYKDSKALHRGIVIGTIVMGWLVVSLHLAGVFSRYFLPEIPRSDLAIPLLTLKIFPGWLAGIILMSILAAALGTIDSQLVITTGAIVKDLYATYLRPNLEERALRKLTYLVTTVLVAIVAFSTLHPPDLLIWLNLFGLGGLEATFLWPYVFGLYWKRANKYGAISSMIAGTLTYVILYYKYGSNFYNLHPIVPALLIGAVVFVIVALATPAPPKEITEKF